MGPRLGGSSSPGGGPLDVITPVGAPAESAFEPAAIRRLLGRHGREAADAIAAARPGETVTIEGSRDLLLDVRWAARAEGVVHLEDLLLRRVRVGLQLPGGGAEVLDQIRAIARPELGWDNARWEAEEAAYRLLWATAYAPRPE